MKPKRYLQSIQDRVLFIGAIVEGGMGVWNMSGGFYWATTFWGCIAVISFLLAFIPDDSENDNNSDNNVYSNMIVQLAEMSRSLIELSDFLEREKIKVEKTEYILNELQKKKAELDPIVNTQQQTVDAIFTTYTEKSKISIWKTSFIGFCMGILSSTIATWIWTTIINK